MITAKRARHTTIQAHIKTIPKVNFIKSQISLNIVCL